MENVQEESPSRPKRTCVIYNPKAPEKASRISQRSQRGQGGRRKNSQVSLFAEKEQDRSQQITPTLGVNRHPFTPPVPCLQDSTTFRGGVLDSIPVESESTKQHVEGEEFSHGGLHHHDDGVGRRLDGFGTPPFDIGPESSSSSSLEMTIPDSVEYTRHLSSRPGCYGMDHSKELNSVQIRNQDDCMPSSPPSNPVADMMRTLLGAKHSNIPHGGDYRYTSEERNVRMQEEVSSEDETFTHRQAIQVSQRNRARVIQEDEGNHDSGYTAIRGRRNASNDDIEGNGHSNVISNNGPGIHGNTSNRVQENLGRRRNEGSENVNRRSKGGNHDHSHRRHAEPMNNLETRDNASLTSHPFSLNKNGGRASTRISELVGEEKQQRREYEKLRKRAWRASNAINRKTGAKAQCSTGSISLVTKSRLKLFQGMPYGESHVALVRELSKLIRAKLKSFRYASSITKEEIQHIHELLHQNYENGNELILHWTELHVKSLLRSWRKSVRVTIRDHLSNLAPNTTNPIPPPGVSEEEMVEFSKQLAHKDFQQTKSDMLTKSKDMVSKQGCANPMGSGGVRKANTHYIVTKGRLASNEEIQAWKDTARAAYNHKAQLKASIPQGENATRDDVLLQETMGPDWTHPFRGPKAFFDKFVEIFGKDPTDAQISAWLNNGRPSLSRPRS